MRGADTHPARNAQPLNVMTAPRASRSLLDGHDLPIPLVGPAALHFAIGKLFQRVRIEVIPATAEHALQEDPVAITNGTTLLFDDHNLLPLAPWVIISSAHRTAHDVHVYTVGHHEHDDVAALDLTAPLLLDLERVLLVLFRAARLHPLLLRSAIDLTDVPARHDLDVHCVAVANGVPSCRLLLGSAERHAGAGARHASGRAQRGPARNEGETSCPRSNRGNSKDERPEGTQGHPGPGGHAVSLAHRRRSVGG
mmetsp:Transcript_51001/g.142711  ORF Transcript_51001/g.142711 Transcript_51001/m.142711 type:complete len:253 (-) Transcript_51001:45-803(-)